MSMLPAYRVEAPSTALVTYGSNLGWQPSAGTKAWVRERLRRMAAQEGKTIAQLEPAFAPPPHCPKQRAEMDMLMESRQEHVQRWLNERREREEVTSDSEDGGDGVSVCFDELHQEIDEVCPHDRPPEWYALRYEQARREAVTKTPPPVVPEPPELPEPPEPVPASGWSPEQRGVKRPLPEPVPAPELSALTVSPERAAPVRPCTPPPTVRCSYC
jgi:hypothetical protein